MIYNNTGITLMASISRHVMNKVVGFEIRIHFVGCGDVYGTSWKFD